MWLQKVFDPIVCTYLANSPPQFCSRTGCYLQFSKTLRKTRVETRTNKSQRATLFLFCLSISELSEHKFNFETMHFFLVQNESQFRLGRKLRADVQYFLTQKFSDVIKWSRQRPLYRLNYRQIACNYTKQECDFKSDFIQMYQVE